MQPSPPYTNKQQGPAVQLTDTSPP